MSNTSFVQDLLSTLFQRSIPFSKQSDKRSAEELCAALLSGRGEASGTKMAQALLFKYDAMADDEKMAFFIYLLENLDVDIDKVIDAANDYRARPEAQNLKKLQKVSEPVRLDLFRRLNSAEGGTEKLVKMRSDLLSMTRNNPGLARLDVDLEHLFAAWFNRGFLVMHKIDWQTPAHILEKIISYEAVHEISSWEDLRRRLLPEDRRCYAFFHPALHDEPLIFVEVALSDHIPGSIQDVLAEDRTPIEVSSTTTAVFYSISNCQKGLQGISFGNFLIKQVASDLSRDLPNLKTFVTLSPVPTFVKWLHSLDLETEGEALSPLLERLENTKFNLDVTDLDDLEQNVIALAARYFLQEKRADSQPLDPVARFHLGNGASLRQINWMGDRSQKGFAQSAGLMVNYLYDLEKVEENHEAYAQNREINAHKSIRNLLDKSRPSERTVLKTE